MRVKCTNCNITFYPNIKKCSVCGGAVIKFKNHKRYTIKYRNAKKH